MNPAALSCALSPWARAGVRVDGAEVSVAHAATETHAIARADVSALALSLALSLALLLPGCGTPELQPPAAAPAAAAPDMRAGPPTPASEFEHAQRERALAAARQGHWAEVALAWELLTVLRPGSAEYRERLAETQARIEALVSERLPRAALAAQRGDLDAAMQHYLAIVALQPGHGAAADALRALERERNRKLYLGRYSRHTLTRRALGEAEMPARSAAPRARSGVPK